ncbi:hypothetical protein V5799_003950 [Amblyomma americanum]|uniref:Uncharacterized protein n=1 Tax=Amblyomma americanum TaxID=6943 RepID=A0AAQ4D7H7_AMBAM
MHKRKRPSFFEVPYISALGMQQKCSEHFKYYSQAATDLSNISPRRRARRLNAPNERCQLRAQRVRDDAVCRVAPRAAPYGRASKSVLS